MQVHVFRLWAGPNRTSFRIERPPPFATMSSLSGIDGAQRNGFSFVDGAESRQSA